MNVDELYAFATWLQRSADNVRPKYEEVHRILQHNATQANKLPLEGALKNLNNTLKEVALSELDSEQVRLLNAYGVDDYFGRRGQHFVTQTITKSGFDPATAAGDFQAAVQAIASASDRAKSLCTAFAGVKDWTTGSSGDEPNLIQIRVAFREDASISNVVEWKKWGTKWYDIARGVAMAAGAAPEEVRVLGATRGSIVLTLATTGSVILILGSIMKVITRGAYDVLKLAHTVEDLKQKKLLTHELEAAFQKRTKEIRESGVAEAMDAVMKSAPRSDGELENAIKKSVSELFVFCTSGGDVDFVSPAAEPRSQGESDGQPELVQDIRGLIEEIRSFKEALHLLSFEDHSNSNNEP